MDKEVTVYMCPNTVQPTKGNFPFVITWVDFKVLMLSEMNQRVKENHDFVHGIKKQKQKP